MSQANPDDLRAEALGLFGWARDRAAHGSYNRGAWTWMQAAHEALAAYRRRATKAAAEPEAQTRLGYYVTNQGTEVMAVAA